MKFNRILFPVDFSDYSRNCLKLSSTLMKDDQTREFHFIYILRTPSDFAVWQDDPQSEVRELLDEMMGYFDHPGEYEKVPNVVTGHPATEICRYASEKQCDLVVMATHGRTGLKHMLMGSTAEQVVRRASCPVLTMRVGPASSD